MTNKNDFLYWFIPLFIAILITAISITVSVTQKQITEEIDNKKIASDLLQEKDENDIIDGESILPPFELEADDEVISYQNKEFEIINIDKPLPIFPSENRHIINNEILQKKGILKNLYKESNKYYIKEYETKKEKPKFYKGLPE